MSRRSSYGYGSYGSRSYGYGGYRRNRRNDDGKKKWIIAAIVIIILAAAAVGVCAWLGVFEKKEDEQQPAESIQSSADVSEAVKETSKEVSEKPKTSSAAESSAPEKELKGEFDGNVFIYDKQGYEIFYGTEETAKSYASVVSQVKALAGNGVKVYNLVAPTHSYYGLPEKYLSSGNDEKNNIKTIYNRLGNDVVTIDIFDALQKHKNEYLYFKTDHNWTALGAYYAYCEFCKAAGVKAIDIKSLSSGEIKGFTGSLIAATKTESNPKGNKILAANADIVKYYNIPGDRTCTLLENGKSSPEEVSMIATFAEGSNAYSAFIWGNNPYMHIKTQNKSGRKLCIIKDSYGCAFAPFTAANFDEIYIVDPTYYDGNVIDFIKKNKYTDVLVLNSVMTANTQIRINEIKTII